MRKEEEGSVEKDKWLMSRTIKDYASTQKAIERHTCMAYINSMYSISLKVK
jgi:hypothetical protein